MQAKRSPQIDGVLILECLDHTDPGSEGRFLSHMFNIMGVQSQYLEVQTKQQFLAMLNANPFNTVHITTHGSVASPSEEFRGFWTRKGIVRIDDFSNVSLKEKIVVSTACRSGTTKFAKPFCAKTSPKFYVAPRASPKFSNAIYFSHWFYHNVIVLKLSVADAIKKYGEGYKNPHDFSLCCR